MNIRKNIDYREMYAALDHAMAAQMEQMELYCAIGKVISLRPEKGAAVAAAKYLADRYPDAHGFSPRNVRRMRDFYRTYEKHSVLLTLALQIGWTQNVVILEADLRMELCEWYLRAAKQFGWSKIVLISSIAANAHEHIVLPIEEEVCYIGQKDENSESLGEKTTCIKKWIQQKNSKVRSWWKNIQSCLQRWLIMLCQVYKEKRTVFIRC